MPFDVALRSTYLSLASGGGGLDVGVDLGSGGGAVPVCYVERELTAAALLAHRMEAKELPPGPIWSDLLTFDAREWRGLVDGVVAGFPCQPYSVAGKRRGAADERDLWDECLRVLVDSHARWAFFENVGGARTEYEWRFGPDLMAAGFRSRAVVVRASDVGAPHRRARLFFAAVADASRCGRDGRAHEQERNAVGRAVAEGAGGSLADASHERHERSGGARGGRGGPAHDSSAVADADDDAGQEGRGQPLGERADECIAWPPGPESDEWSRIYAVRPDLAPAVPKSPLRGSTHGLALGLDGVGDEELPTVRRDDGAEAGGARQRAGITFGVRPSQVLRPSVHGCGDAQTRERVDALWALGEGSEEFGVCLRALRDHGEACDPSHRQELAEQLAREPDDVMRFLSQQAPPRAWRHRYSPTGARLSRLRQAILAERFSGQDVLALVWPAYPADGLDLSRADWLRILGNGVVPQQAALAWRLLWSELT